MNTAADRDRRQLIGATRGRDLYWGITIAVFGNLFTLYIISQGGDLPQLAITAAIVGIFVFVMINSFDCMDDLKANIDDLDDDEASTNFGKKFKAAPWGMFKVVITLIFGAIAITQLLEIW
jgi:hypothetical protein